MAFHNEIGAGRYNRLFQKLFNMKGGPPARQLGTDVMVMLPLFAGPELRVLESWFRWGAVGDAGPTAANQSGVRFRNPSGSNVIAVFEKLTVSCSATDRLLVQQGQATTDLATGVALVGNRLDSRSGPTTRSPVVIESQQATAVALPALTNQFTFWAPLALANTPYDVITFEDQELTLMPGDAFQISAVTVNERLLTSAIWRERALEDSEILAGT